MEIRDRALRGIKKTSRTSGKFNLSSQIIPKNIGLYYVAIDVLQKDLDI